MYCSSFAGKSGLWRRSLLVIASLALLPAAAYALEAGEPAPALELSARKGKFDWSSLKGQVVYLDFWASWCGPCRKSFPWMNEVQKKYADKGFKVVGVNLDANMADADKFLEKVPAEFLLAFDPQGVSPRLYGVKGMPTSYLIDRTGKVIYRHMGFNDEGKAELEKAIRSALEQK